MTHSPLPVEEVLPQLVQVLQHQYQVVLEAPPGAGKTTLVPLALLQADWLAGQKILMLEPRRIAARAAAERMAELLGERVGQTVGYRIRLENRCSERTRIEVITEGILSRRLQNDAELRGVGVIIFDEFHERNLESDLALALTLQAREVFRQTPPLRLVLMSATLAGIKLPPVFQQDEVVHSDGRQFPVEVIYAEPWRAADDITLRVVQTIQRALQQQEGSLLVFLPGRAEIQRVRDALNAILPAGSGIIPTPLYGDLPLEEQRQAIQPARGGERKIVLATDIAETSLTIEGVTVVIDVGLGRYPSFDHASGMTRLHTRRISVASSVQRSGRAGRLQPGTCYRLWSESQQAQLIPHSPAEILQADLVPLALQLVKWGCETPDELPWIDAPPSAPYDRALELLARLGALQKDAAQHWRLSPHGESMASLPVHPRLAHLLLTGVKHGLTQVACDLAALLAERDPMPGSGADIALRMSLLQADGKVKGISVGVRQRLLRQGKNFYRLLNAQGNEMGQQADDPRWMGFLLACAYPDRIARQRQAGSNEYQLSNGRAARLRADDALQQAPWIVVAQLGGKPGQAVDQIYLAASFDQTLLQQELSHLCVEQEYVGWDNTGERLVAENRVCIGSLVITRNQVKAVSVDKKRVAIFTLLRKKGLQLLNWSEALRQWQHRVQLLRQQETDTQGKSEWPDVADTALLENLEQWLAPYVDQVNHINHFAALDLQSILHNQIDWKKSQQLAQQAPEKLTVPSGSQIRIDYSESPPVLAVRLQEMFGCVDTPTIANGNIALKIHLLSPARHPLQVTQDLASFWRNGYAEVKKEMKGRYPKHPWPDDPLSAPATSRAKRSKKRRQ